MSVTTTNNMMDVFVAKEVAPATYANVTSDLQATLAQGQIAVVGFYAGTNGGFEEKLGAHAVTAANYPYIRFVKETASGELLYGSKIYGKDLVALSSAVGVAPVEQVYFIGYNGTSGSLDVSSANEFILTIAYDHDDMMWSEQKMRNSYDYYSPAPTQVGLATSMASQIAYKEQLAAINGTGRMVIAEVLNNAAAGTVTTFGAGLTAKVNQGSDIMTVSGAFSGSITVGTALRLGTDAVTGAIYFVTAVNNTNAAANGLPAYGIKLNMAYQGASNTALNVQAGAGNSGFIAAGSLGTSWGIRITGQPLTWKKDFFKYNKVKFHFDMKGFGATPFDRPGALTSSASKESSKGKGYWQEVSEMESFSAGFQGALNRTVVPLPTGLIETPTTTPAFAGAAAGLGANYCMWYIESRDTQNNSPIVATTPMRVQTYVFFPAGTQGAAQQSDLVGNWDIDAWFTAFGFTLTTVPGT